MQLPYERWARIFPGQLLDGSAASGNIHTRVYPYSHKVETGKADSIMHTCFSAAFWPHRDTPVLHTGLWYRWLK